MTEADGEPTMGNQTARDRFLKHCEAAKQAYRDDTDPLEREPLYLQTLSYIKSHPEATDWFKNQIIEMVRHPELEFINLIEYCMHDLKWDEVADAAREVAFAITNSMPRVGMRWTARDSLVVKWMAIISESFTDHWVGLAFYDYYRKKPQR